MEIQPTAVLTLLLTVSKVLVFCNNIQIMSMSEGESIQLSIRLFDFEVLPKKVDVTHTLFVAHGKVYWKEETLVFKPRFVTDNSTHSYSLTNHSTTFNPLVKNKQQLLSEAQPLNTLRTLTKF
jgi:hypothetical protein